MARRGNIAALGALAALGAGILENKRNKDKVPVEDLSGAGTSKKEIDYGEDYGREVNRAGRGPVASLAGAAKTKTPAPKAESATESKSEPTSYTRGKEALSDYRQRQARDVEAGMTRGTRPQESSSYTGQGGSGRGGQGGPTAQELAMHVQAPSTAQIQSGLESSMGGGPGLKALSAAAKNLAGTAKTGRNAAQQAWDRSVMADRVNPARPAAPKAAQEVAEETGRESVLNPLNWMSGRRGELGRKGLSEADTTGGAIGYRKGGKTESKPAAKGWGKARGARQAKYY